MAPKLRAGVDRRQRANRAAGSPDVGCVDRPTRQNRRARRRMTGGRLQYEAEHGRRHPQRIDQRGVAIRQFLSEVADVLAVGVGGEIADKARLARIDPARPEDAGVDHARVGFGDFLRQQFRQHHPPPGPRPVARQTVPVDIDDGHRRLRARRRQQRQNLVERPLAGVLAEAEGARRPEQQRGSAPRCAEQGNRPSPRPKSHRSFWCHRPRQSPAIAALLHLAARTLLGRRNCQLLDRHVLARLPSGMPPATSVFIGRPRLSGKPNVMLARSSLTGRPFTRA